MVMKDELVGIVIAKLAKDKKFDIQTEKYWCNYYIGEPHNKWKLLPFSELSLNWAEYPAPTQSLLQRWLRETHEIHVEVISKKYKTKVATCIPRTFKYIINGTYSLTVYNTYEDALDEGLLQGLQLIK